LQNISLRYSILFIECRSSNVVCMNQTDKHGVSGRYCLRTGEQATRATLDANGSVQVRRHVFIKQTA
jgi:hypothetical protein